MVNKGKSKWKILLIQAMLIGILLFGGCNSEMEPDPAYDENLETQHKLTEEQSIEKDHTNHGGNHGAANDEKNLEITELIQSMSIEAKAGQVLIVAYRLNSINEPMQQLDESIRKEMSELQPGGIILFSENIQDGEQTRNLIEEFQSASSIPLLITVDEEGGRVSRLSNNISDFPVLPPARVLGLAGDVLATHEMGRQLGTAMKHLGFNMNMAPVADVDSNESNPVIGDRSYGNDPVLVGDMATAMASGLWEAGIIPVLKHFPGHGDTDDDSHDGSVVLAHHRDRMESVELLPFKMGINAGLPAIMTAHIFVPSYDEQMPATLSHKILTGLLRDSLGFEGIIITDALDMAAITNEWSSGEAAVKALVAGADLLLMPENPVEAHDAIVAAVVSGTLPVERLDEAVTRNLHLKLNGGLLDFLSDLESGQ